MSESTATAERAITAYNDYKSVQSESTAREYRRAIGRFRDYLDEHTDVGLWDCHSGHVERFYEFSLNNEGYSPSSVRVSHAALSDFYTTVDEFSGRRGFPQVSVGHNPTDNATPERIDGMYQGSKKDKEGGDKPLTKDEVQQLVDHVPPDKPVRNELIVRLLYQTGVRRSELVRIKLDHIDRDDRRIRVYGKKTDDSRNVWYQPSLDSLLNLWINGDRNAVFNAAESDYLFPSRVSERLSEQTVTDVVTTAAERAGIQETVYTDKAGQPVHRVGAHTLRKSFGVHFINDGGDISFLMELLGHNDIETTKENYLKYSTADLRDSAREHIPSI